MAGGEDGGGPRDGEVPGSPPGLRLGSLGAPGRNSKWGGIEGGDFKEESPFLSPSLMVDILYITSIYVDEKVLSGQAYAWMRKVLIP